MKTLLAILLLASQAIAAPVTLAWDKNPEPEVLTYELRYGTDPANLTGKARVENAIEVTVDLKPGLYYFEVVAIVGASESLPSERISHQVRPAAPTRLRVSSKQTSANDKDWKSIARSTTRRK